MFLSFHVTRIVLNRPIVQIVWIGYVQNVTKILLPTLKELSRTY